MKLYNWNVQELKYSWWAQHQNRKNKEKVYKLEDQVYHTCQISLSIESIKSEEQRQKWLK